MKMRVRERVPPQGDGFKEEEQVALSCWRMRGENRASQEKRPVLAVDHARELETIPRLGSWMPGEQLLQNLRKREDLLWKGARRDTSIRSFAVTDCTSPADEVPRLLIHVDDRE